MMTIKVMPGNQLKLAMAILVMASSAVTPASNASSTGATSLPDIVQVKANAKRYGGTLKALLKKTLTEEGPVAAIDVCSNEAGRIGGEISRETGWSIRRVSNLTRNPLAMPDQYEAQMLKVFAQKIAQRPDTTALAKYEVVTENGVSYARFMKGIRVQAVCLACHGSVDKKSAVGKKLAQSYQHDKARGYKLGDLRGALSIKIKLD